MTLFLGIDPSAKRIAIVGYESVTMAQMVAVANLYPKGTTRQTPESLGVALDFMSHWLAQVALVAPDDRVAYVEKPLVGRGGISATVKQSYVGGIIRGCLAASGFRVYDAQSARWRSELRIKAKGTAAIKAETKKVVASRWPKIMQDLGDDADLIDAAGICLYGREQDRKARLLVPTEPA